MFKNGDQFKSNTLTYICVCVYILVFIIPLNHRRDVTQGQFFKWNSTGLNWELSFCLTGCYTKVKEPVCPTIYP